MTTETDRTALRPSPHLPPKWSPTLGPWLLGLSLLATVGCSRSDASELPEWSPADHDNQSKPGAGQVDTAERKAQMPDLTKQGVDDVVLAAWKQNCVPCHGVIGRGDGPQGRSMRPPDFTNPRWHRTALDSEMAYAIQKGRGNMPAFAHLPEPTVQGLVKLVRMLNPDRARDAAAEEQAPVDENAAAAAPASEPQKP